MQNSKGTLTVRLSQSDGSLLSCRSCQVLLWCCDACTQCPFKTHWSWLEGVASLNILAAMFAMQFLGSGRHVFDWLVWTVSMGLEFLREPRSRVGLLWETFVQHLDAAAFLFGGFLIVVPLALAAKFAPQFAGLVFPSKRETIWSSTLI